MARGWKCFGDGCGSRMTAGRGRQQLGGGRERAMGWDGCRLSPLRLEHFQVLEGAQSVKGLKMRTPQAPQLLVFHSVCIFTLHSHSLSF